MILARYSGPKVSMCCIGATIVVIFVLITPFIHPGGASAYFADDNYWVKIYPITAVLATVSLVFIFKLAINAASGGAVAIILDGDVLRLISGRVIQIPKQDIDMIDLQIGGAFPFQFTYLCFHLRESKDRKVPTSLFRESAETIRNRIQVALSLPS